MGPNENVEFLRRERPFLSLSILTFEMQTKPQMQKALELELRLSLSKQVVVEMEKNLDILQGLLVYLVW